MTVIFCVIHVAFLSRSPCIKFANMTRGIFMMVESSWNVTAHCDAREGKWRGNWRMEWLANILTLSRNMVYPALLPLMRTPRLPVVEWTDAPADLMDSSVSPKKEIWFLRVCHHISNAVCQQIGRKVLLSTGMLRSVYWSLKTGPRSCSATSATIY
jgi:hypothetical protein